VRNKTVYKEFEGIIKELDRVYDVSFFGFK
jgi:hypothetical protein